MFLIRQMNTCDAKRSAAETNLHEQQSLKWGIVNIIDLLELHMPFEELELLHKLLRFTCTGF